MRKLHGILGHLALLGSIFGGGPAFGETSAGVAALEKITARFPTMDAFLKDKAARKEYEQALTRYFGKTQFPCDGFSEVVDQVRRWVEADGSVAERLWAPQKEWRHGISWKPVKGAAADYQFVSLPRKFHGVWLDLSKAGCFEGPCAPLTWGAPGRFASVLDGTALFHVEKGGHYSGSSLVVYSAKQGEQRLRVVAPSASALLTDRGFAAGEKKATTLVEQWAAAAKGKTPLVYVDAKDRVKEIGHGKLFGGSTSLRFGDGLASTLMKVVPPKCSSESKVAIGEGAKPIAGGVASAGGSGNATAPTAKDQFGALLVALGQPPSADPAKPETRAALEKSLGDELSKSPDPKKRAMAAMALDLIDELGPKKPPRDASWEPDAYLNPRKRRKSSPGKTGYDYLDGYSKPARTALNKGLRDPDPAVRTHSAFAISGADRGGLWESKNLPRELKELRQDIGNALREAYNRPTIGSWLNMPTTIQNFSSPEVIRERALDERIKQGETLTPKEQTDSFRDAATNPDPKIRQVRVSEVAKPLIKDRDPSHFPQNLANLEKQLAGQSVEYQRAVLASVEKELADDCESCGIPLPVKEKEEK